WADAVIVAQVRGDIIKGDVRPHAVAAVAGDANIPEVTRRGGSHLRERVEVEKALRVPAAGAQDVLGGPFEARIDGVEPTWTRRHLEQIAVQDAVDLAVFSPDEGCRERSVRARKADRRGEARDVEEGLDILRPFQGGAAELRVPRSPAPRAPRRPGVER